METTCSEGEVFFAQALSGAAIPARFSSAQVQALARMSQIRKYDDVPLLPVSTSLLSHLLSIMETCSAFLNPPLLGSFPAGPSLLWCGSLRHRYFRTTGEALAGVSRMTICLAKRLLFMRGTNWQDSFLIG